MKQILENLNLDESTKLELQKSFDAAVLVEALTIAESKEDAYEEYMLAQLTEMKEDLENTLDSYLDKVVEQFVEDNTFAIDESVKSEKYDAVLEGFNSLMIASGVEIAQIAEAKELESSDYLSESLSDMNDSLMSDNIDLKERNAELLKTGLIKESMDGMTVLEKERFTRLAQVVEFNQEDPSDFIDKIDVLVESVKGSKKEVTQKPKHLDERMIVESRSTYTSSANHLF